MKTEPAPGVSPEALGREVGHQSCTIQGWFLSLTNRTDYEAIHVSSPKLSYSRSFWSGRELTFDFEIPFNPYREISSESLVRTPVISELVLRFMSVASCSSWWFNLNLVLAVAGLGCRNTDLFTFEDRAPWDMWSSLSWDHRDWKLQSFTRHLEN